MLINRICPRSSQCFALKKPKTCILLVITWGHVLGGEDHCFDWTKLRLKSKSYSRVFACFVDFGLPVFWSRFLFSCALTPVCVLAFAMLFFPVLFFFFPLCFFCFDSSLCYVPKGHHMWEVNSALFIEKARLEQHCSFVFFLHETCCVPLADFFLLSVLLYLSTKGLCYSANSIIIFHCFISPCFHSNSSTARPWRSWACRITTCPTCPPPSPAWLTSKSWTSVKTVISLDHTHTSPS